jgi:hypothetical protein
MIATQTACFVAAGASGDLRVQLRSTHWAAAAALAVAAALSGCGVDFDVNQAWFSKPFQVVSQKGGYTFSELQESKDLQRPITANDLVNSNGSCPAPPAPVPVAPQASAGAGNQPAPPVAPADAGSLLGGGVALGMSECDVVFRAGQPGAVQIGQNPNGDRTAVLTFPTGPRPGIYHFRRGALVELDRVAEPAPPPQQTAKKKSAKSAKSAKSNKPQKKDDQT